MLVIFVIRTARPFWKSHPHPILTVTSLGALAAALLLALTPAGAVVGFVPLPPSILAAMLGVSAVYLVLAEMLKRTAADAPRCRRYRR